MSDTVELKTFPVVSNNNNVANELEIEVIPGNGTTEASNLLSTQQDVENNRDIVHPDAVDSVSTTNTSRCRRELRSVKESLNEVVVWRLRLWVVILLVLCLIILVVTITIIAYAVEEDLDDNYDKSTFKVNRLFWGNFTLSNSSFTSYPEDNEKLTELLKEQLTDVYSSSHALGRYFSNVSINRFQNATAQFELHFLMPLENKDLKRFTLSVNMVKNVLLQHFYDQDAADAVYVIPTSLSMKELDKNLK